MDKRSANDVTPGHESGGACLRRHRAAESRTARSGGMNLGGTGMHKRDYYEILGVTRACTEVELKAAFRKLAMQHHPDRNPGDKDCEHRFKEINEAYDVLKDG